MQTNRRKELFIGAVFVVIVVGLMIVAGVASSGQSTAPTPDFVSTQTSVIAADDHVRGARDAAVSVIEYGDFQCPACGAYEPVMQRLEAEYGDRVAFVFRNFPLYQAHPNASLGAQAAEAAGLQGKYWEMHDILYAKQNEWSLAAGGKAREYVDGYARSFGLDMARFAADMQSDVVTSKIARDVAGGNTARVDHTPTFFINLAQIPNPSGYDDFKALLDAALASSTTQR